MQIILDRNQIMKSYDFVDHPSNHHFEKRKIKMLYFVIVIVFTQNNVECQ